MTRIERAQFANAALFAIVGKDRRCYDHAVMVAVNSRSKAALATTRWFQTSSPTRTRPCQFNYFTNINYRRSLSRAPPGIACCASRSHRRSRQRGIMVLALANDNYGEREERERERERAQGTGHGPISFLDEENQLKEEKKKRERNPLFALRNSPDVRFRQIIPG